MTEKAKRLFWAVRLWAISQGMTEIDTKPNQFNALFFKNIFTTAFIPEVDKNQSDLLKCIESVKSDFIYIVTDNSAKCRELVNVLPCHCGILCYSNPCGLGYTYQVLKQPTIAD